MRPKVTKEARQHAVIWNQTLLQYLHRAKPRARTRHRPPQRRLPRKPNMTAWRIGSGLEKKAPKLTHDFEKVVSNIWHLRGPKPSSKSCTEFLLLKFKLNSNTTQGGQKWDQKMVPFLTPKMYLAGPISREQLATF